MSELVLGPLLRHVDQTSATVWVETARSCTVSVLSASAPTFAINGRHYGLVIVEGLAPGSTTEYEVLIDGDKVWPELDSTFPPSVIRTDESDADTSILVGSCRAAAPHEPPYNLELAFNVDGRGVDTLWAHAHRMRDEDPEKWPNLLLLIGDQIYADDSSPESKKRIEERRERTGSDLEVETVAQYDEYCWLYHEAWSKPWERWLLSNVPSAMIFDDHDMIDDWNISRAWAEDIQREPWWSRHVVDGLASYWVYQHLGNLSPEQIRRDGLLAQLQEADNGTEILLEWARQVDADSPGPDGFHFSFERHVGDVTVLVVDCRNGRVFTDDERLIVGRKEWKWVADQAKAAPGHLVIATSVPVFIPDGLHDLQVWNEQLCAGRFGRRIAAGSERLRRSLDLEDWSAFAESFADFSALLHDLTTAVSPPLSVVVASGDIHFSYAAHVPAVSTPSLPVWQIVSSPTRNALIPHERGVLRMSLGSAGRFLGDLLRRSAGVASTRPGIELAAGPLFANNMVELHYVGGDVTMQIEQSAPGDEGRPELKMVAELDLMAMSS